MKRTCSCLMIVCCLLEPGRIWGQELPPEAEPVAGIESIIVRARLRREEARLVPISMSVISRETLDASQTINVSQLTQLLPSLHYSSPNPRNTALSIRGLGSSVVAVAQANDGLEPGVGFYIDQVYHARPASAAFDFLDLESVEVLRGPQGSLFGKNTTAGALNITTRAPSFDPSLQVELSAGNFAHRQATISLTGPIFSDEIAGKLAISSNRREGVLRHATNGKKLNDTDNTAARTQFLYKPNTGFQLLLSADYAAMDPQCCTQVYYRTGASLLPIERQYAALADSQNYQVPSEDGFDRLTDIDASLKVSSHEGGVSALAEWNFSRFLLTSVSAWRYWQWDAANDRDYTGLSIQTVQHIPSRQDQYSQELRISSTGTNVFDYTAGLYFFNQEIAANPVTEYGPLASVWLLGSTAPSALLDGYRTDGDSKFKSDSYALFGESTWHVLPRLSFSIGARYTYEYKTGEYAAAVSGGLVSSDPDLNRQKLSILRPQSYQARVADGSLSGRANIAWHWTENAMVYLMLAQGSKSGGINMSGLPFTSENQPALATAEIKPELHTTAEIGIKASLWRNRLAGNVDVFTTYVKDFQANVVSTAPGALRGYLANVERVKVQGVELEASLALSRTMTANVSAAITRGRYVSYRNAPCPLESISQQFDSCDLSGRPLASLPEQTFSGSLAYKRNVEIGDVGGYFFMRADWSHRSAVYMTSPISRFTKIAGVELLNGSMGFSSDSNWEILAWVHNLLDVNYMQSVTVQAGNSGLIVGLPSDPLTVGLTLKLDI